jgi:hypothetical protein
MPGPTVIHPQSDRANVMGTKPPVGSTSLNGSFGVERRHFTEG